MFLKDDQSARGVFVPYKTPPIRGLIFKSKYTTGLMSPSRTQRLHYVIIPLANNPPPCRGVSDPGQAWPNITIQGTQHE